MSNITREQYYSIIKKVFSFVETDYGFSIFQKENKMIFIVIAKKQDIELVFQLEMGVYSSISFRLSG